MSSEFLSCEIYGDVTPSGLVPKQSYTTSSHNVLEILRLRLSFNPPPFLFVIQALDSSENYIDVLNRTQRLGILRGSQIFRGADFISNETIGAAIPFSMSGFLRPESAVHRNRHKKKTSVTFVMCTCGARRNFLVIDRVYHPVSSRHLAMSER